MGFDRNLETIPEPQIPGLKNTVTVELRSNGGNVFAAMEAGRILRKARVWTAIGNDSTPFRVLRRYRTLRCSSPEIRSSDRCIAVSVVRHRDVLGSTTPVEIRKIAQLAARYEWQ